MAATDRDDYLARAKQADLAAASARSADEKHGWEELAREYRMLAAELLKQYPAGPRSPS